ncbi:MAG: helix-turn-helix domain-containing protein, partial [Candidatus Calescibacterium sp.]
YDWPGNVRELYNVLERAFILSWSGQKNVKVLPENIIFSTSDLISALGKNSDFKSKEILGSNEIDLGKKDYQRTEAVEAFGTKKEGSEFSSGDKKEGVGIQKLGFGVNFDDLNIKNMEKIFILEALARTGGNKTKAAQLLGITVRTLRNKLKELNIQKGSESDLD